VRVIAPDGQQLGIKTLPDALKLAQELDLDLVEVAPLANPPVCRVMDFKKWQYEEKQKAKESRKKSSSISIKEMKYRPKIGQGDFDTKTRKVAEFLSEGHKVKITIMFRGREVFHPELGGKILDAIAEQVTAVGKVETHARLDGRNMTMVLAPDKRAQAAAAKREPRESTPPDPAAPAPVAEPVATVPAGPAPAPSPPSVPAPAPAPPTVEAPAAPTPTPTPVASAAPAAAAGAAPPESQG
jgi:translation initiation factor IF-3